MSEPTWPNILNQLLSGENMSRDESSWAMREIMNGNATEAQMGAFMIALRSKAETVQELAGLVDVMLENAVLLETGNDAVDIVGTGGDMFGTVNISSMASIVAAASGVPVLKHGSRSASGKTGASEMLEVLGIRLDLSPQQVAKVFSQAGITFFFAPVFHPAMRHVAPVRKQLGIPTTFNFLGPLANPVQPLATALGVSDKKGAPLMAKELSARGRTGLVFRADDGMDELSTTSENSIWEVSQGEIREHRISAEDLGLKVADISELLGGDARHNAHVASSLFAGEKFENDEAIKNMVALNAAAGLVSYELANNPSTVENNLVERLSVALGKTLESITSGKAGNKLEEWTKASHSA
jgi:anthranilate phosphoribosyltransferase